MNLSCNFVSCTHACIQVEWFSSCLPRLMNTTLIMKLDQNRHLSESTSMNEWWKECLFTCGFTGTKFKVILMNIHYRKNLEIHLIGWFTKKLGIIFKLYPNTKNMTGMDVFITACVLFVHVCQWLTHALDVGVKTNLSWLPIYNVVSKCVKNKHSGFLIMILLYLDSLQMNNVCIMYKCIQ